MPDLPSGTVTLLFTDIEGSTRLLEELGAGYSDVLAHHRLLLQSTWSRHSGVIVDTQGDAFFVAFDSAPEAVNAAAEAQEALADAPVRVRIGLHTGDPAVTEHGYVGLDVHRAARVMAAGHGGQVLLTQSTRKLLDSGVPLFDLGEHRLKDLTEPVRLYQLGDEKFPALRTLESRPTNLPAQPTALIGRERELADVATCLAEARLVTLTGPGGTGKTRLALQVGAELIERYASGIFFVALAPVADPALVLPTIARALALREEPGRPIEETLADYLLEKEMLLVLDNLEQVVRAAPRIAELLARAPEVAILATSREPLRVAAEREYPVPILLEDDAVSLFRERSPRPLEHAERVQELCRRLDCLPLAIELAAARTKLLSPERLLERLELAVLSAGRRDLPERQRTLRATIAWSYDLLSPEEQQLFRRLAVFVGGWTVEAAEEVCDADLDTLGSLVDKSLVLAADERFTMLETIREFAAERLVESGEEDDLRDRHALWVVRIAEEAGEALERGREDVVWLARLESEHDNVRAALEWSLGGGEPELGGRTAASLSRFWEPHGHYREGRGWADALLERDVTISPSVRLGLLRTSGRLALAAADYAEAEVRLEAAVALARESGDRRETGCLNNLAMATLFLDEGDHRRANTLLDMSSTIARALGDTQALVSALAVRCFVYAELEDYAKALECAEKGLALARSEGAERNVATLANSVGWFAFLQGDLERATEAVEESLAYERAVGNRWRIGLTLGNLGLIALERKRWHEAAARFSEALSVVRDAGGRRNVAAEALRGLGGVFASLGRHEEAARLSGAASTVHEAGGTRSSPAERRIEDRQLAGARAALGAERWEAARQAGASMTFEQAVDYALTLAESA